MSGNSASVSRSSVGVPRASGTTSSSTTSMGGGSSRSSSSSSWYSTPSTSSTPKTSTTLSSPYHLPSTGGSRSTVSVSNPTKTTTSGYSTDYYITGSFGSSRTGTYLQQSLGMTTGSSKVVEDMRAAAYYSPYATGRTKYTSSPSTDYYEEERQRRR